MRNTMTAKMLAQRNPRLTATNNQRIRFAFLHPYVPSQPVNRGETAGSGAATEYPFPAGRPHITPVPFSACHAVPGQSFTGWTRVKLLSGLDLIRL
jgi:hypothetical protein